MLLTTRNRKAFTLIELLVVIAIIAILAAILFPVLAQARAAANKSVDITHWKQGALAAIMYSTDNDEMMLMSNTGGHPTGWGYGPPDKVPMQTAQPYMKNQDVLFSVVDPWGRNKQRIYADQAPYMTTGSAKDKWDYAMGVRSNLGYNYVFLSPWRYIPTPRYIGSASISNSEVQTPSRTVLFGTSIWDRTTSGHPTGAGNWVVEAPCMLDPNGAFLAPVNRFATGSGDGTLYHYSNWGWDLAHNNWMVYGGLWPFHNQVDISRSTGYAGLKDGHVIIGWVDGSVKSKPVFTLLAGCRPSGSLAGRITDPGEYLWDIQGD